MWHVKIVWRQKTFEKELWTSLTRSILQEPDKSCSLSKCHSLVARRLKQFIRNAHNIPIYVFTVHKPCRTYLCLRGCYRQHQKKCKNTDGHCLDSFSIEDEPNTALVQWVEFCTARPVACFGSQMFHQKGNDEFSDTYILVSCGLQWRIHKSIFASQCNVFKSYLNRVSQKKSLLLNPPLKLICPYVTKGTLMLSQGTLLKD